MTTLVEKRNASKFCEFYGEVGHTTDEGTDIAKILRKWSKLDKHGHGKGKRIREPGECYQ
ncbi:hypothetical protein Tco_0081081, partial [Tanacetum coccineum]